MPRRAHVLLRRGKQACPKKLPLLLASRHWCQRRTGTVPLFEETGSTVGALAPRRGGYLCATVVDLSRVKRNGSLEGSYVGSAPVDGARARRRNRLLPRALGQFPRRGNRLLLFDSATCVVLLRILLAAPIVAAVSTGVLDIDLVQHGCKQPPPV